MIIIETAQHADAPFLPDIERASGRAFLQLPRLAWIAEDDVQSVERHVELIATGQAWVAKSRGVIVGFLNAEITDNVLHIWQMAVHAESQKMGVGRALVATAKTAAASAGLSALTLTTFRNVAWNEQFYTSCGFKTLTSKSLGQRLKDILDAEARAGLPRDQRCAMICRIQE